MKTLTVDNKEYYLKLNTRSIMALEESYHDNPVNIMVKEMLDNEGGEKLPKYTTLITLLYHSIKSLRPDFTIDDTLTLMDKYVEDGGDMISLTMLLLEVFQDSGLIPKDADLDLKNALMRGKTPH